MFGVMPCLGARRVYEATAAWTPDELFTGGKAGAYYDISDITTLFQNSAGTTPVTAHGDPVAYIADKSGNGHHLIQTDTSKRPLYQVDGTYKYLLFDGTNDWLMTTQDVAVGCATVICGANYTTTPSGNAGLVTNFWDASAGVEYAFSSYIKAFDVTQGVSNGLANSAHIWISGVQANTLTVAAPKVYSADGTGNAVSNLSFLNGMMLGEDRNLGRYFSGRFYRLICVGDEAADILSEADRNTAEQWVADSWGETLDFTWNPLHAFADNSVGFWYDPSDLTTLFQDSAGTTPVTTDGHPVGKILDKSGNNNHLTQATSGSRPTYRTSGGLHWLELDGSNDHMAISTGTVSVRTIIAGVAVTDVSIIRTLMSLDQTTDSHNVRTYTDSTWLQPNNTFGPFSSDFSYTATGRLNGVAGGYAFTVNVNHVIQQTASSNTTLGYLFSDSTSGARYFHGRFYGCIAVAGLITPTQVTKTDEYYETKTGISF